MCILCVIQEWSRRVAAMLPWLVIPLIGLWALSQLLPPAFRFEITSPRLACLFVLLVTLFWYEILMPRLSAWRLRRNALRQERKRFEAIEMEKLRKTATRRCRNCLTPYRDQNPGGGRFMCSYCGHISKRPVLDLPVHASLGISDSGVIRDLVGKGGRLLNGKTWAENGWICGQELLENGNWVGGFVAGKPNHWRKSGSSVFGGDEHCLAEKSYSGVVIFAYDLLISIFLSIRWVWRKIFRVSSPGNDSSSSILQEELLSKRGENEINYHESRGEKARRKAEEKRQARLERELLEEEERKQREEVARLVEERRRLRDEKLEAEKYNGKSSSSSKEKDSKKEAEKKRHERRKDRDRLSIKSISDAEELDRKSVKEIDRRRQHNDRREQQKSTSDDTKGDHNPETDHGHGAKNLSANNVSRPSTGTKYFDRMKGTFLSSSKAFTGASFFGKGVNVPVSAAKEITSNSFPDHAQSSVHRRDLCRVAGKSLVSQDEKNVQRTVLAETECSAGPKKSWHQLFTRSSSVPASSDTNIISGTKTKPEGDVQIQHLPGRLSSVQAFDNPISIGLSSSPFTLPTDPYQPTSNNHSLVFSPSMEPKLPRIKEQFHDVLPEEPELFEDPCYVPDPASLLGPVSESLNNFLLDKGSEKPCHKDKLSEPSKPSPIESPMSRSRTADEKHITLTLRGRDGQNPHGDDANANEKGTYQMWNSPPLVREGLGLLDGLGLLNRSNSPQKTTTSLFSNEDPLLLGNCQKGGMLSSAADLKNHDSWLQNSLFPPLVGNNTQLSYSAREEGGARDHRSFGPPSAKCWPIHSAEGNGKQSSSATSVGSLFSKPDVQSSSW